METERLSEMFDWVVLGYRLDNGRVATQRTGQVGEMSCSSIRVFSLEETADTNVAKNTVH
jgi:hypothetical protein